MDESPIKIAVIIPVKNDACRLRVLLESLSKQTVAHQIIVVDNGSSDASAVVARDFGASVFDGVGLKVGALRNLGVRQTSKELIAFCDSDHEVPEDWLYQGLGVLAESPEIVACGSHYLPPPNGTWVQRVWAIHRLRGSVRMESADWLGSGNLFVTRDAFEKVSGFREDLIAAEDVDLCHRLVQASGRIVSDRKIRSVHHGEPKTLADFVRKEYWRGSSGLRAWVSQGFPLRDLASFIWPVWHLVFGLLFTSFLLVLAFRRSSMIASMCFVLLVLWIAPSVLLSVRTCLSQKHLRDFPALAILYWCYGMARAAALFNW